MPTPTIPTAVGLPMHEPCAGRVQPLGTNTLALPRSTGAQPEGTPTPRCAFSWAIVTAPTVAVVSVAFSEVVGAEDARSAGWPAHPAVTTATATAKVTERRKGLTSL